MRQLSNTFLLEQLMIVRASFAPSLIGGSKIDTGVLRGMLLLLAGVQPITSSCG